MNKIMSLMIEYIEKEGGGSKICLEEGGGQIARSSLLRLYAG